MDDLVGHVENSQLTIVYSVQGQCDTIISKKRKVI